MTKFNIKLAPYLEDDMVAKIANESRKPVSLRSIARKFHLSVYAVKMVISKLSDSHFNKDSDTSSLSKTLRAI